MKLSRQFTVFGSAIFCVVVFSLYLMLDHLQLDRSKNPSNGGDKFPNVSFSAAFLFFLHICFSRLGKVTN